MNTNWYARIGELGKPIHASDGIRTVCGSRINNRWVVMLRRDDPDGVVKVDCRRCLTEPPE